VEFFELELGQIEHFFLEQNGQRCAAPGTDILAVL
jgi:hypothetical protein